MAALTPEERRLWTMLEEFDGVNSLLEFVPLITPQYEKPEHLGPLAMAFHRAETESVLMVSSTPPRHGKTESILHWAARYISRFPWKTVAYCTYAASLAHSKSRKAMDMAVKAGVQLRTFKASEWRTNRGGGMLATGIGGPLTGQGVDLLIVDDPFKNRKEAESELVRNNVYDWFTSTALTRVEPGGSVIINMARWHDDDLVGRLRQDEQVKWECMNLQAIDDAGQALWPDRWDLEELDKKRRIVGEYDWASLYMGQPMPRSGYLFREPSRYTLPDLSGARIAIGCDPAATAKNSADYSVICVLAANGSGLDQKVYVMDVWRGQVEIPELVRQLKKMQDYWGAPVFVESVGGFKAVPQMLRQLQNGTSQRLRVVDVNPTTDKFLRAQAVKAAWNDGNVMIPFSGPKTRWVEPFVKEVCKFTGKGDAQDDQVDALAHAFNAIDQRLAPMSRGVYAVEGA